MLVDWNVHWDCGGYSGYLYYKVNNKKKEKL